MGSGRLAPCFEPSLLSQDDDGNRSHAVTELADSELADLPVIVDVDYSTLNYKDGLAVVNGAPIVRTWPMVPGVDLAGTVAASQDPAWSPGDKVIVNGWDVGESHWGGMATKAAMDGGWLTPLPEAYTTFQAMAVGTAGYTAMLCVLALEEHGITPDSGPVVVTGAAGGVGSVAVAVLAELDYEVVASSGRVETEGDYLRSLGAAELVHRDELSGPARPWARPASREGSTPSAATPWPTSSPRPCPTGASPPAVWLRNGLPQFRWPRSSSGP